MDADATQNAKHIPSYSFFLMHGLADLTAPYLHGTQLARALTQAGVIFQYQVSCLCFVIELIETKSIPLLFLWKTKQHNVYEVPLK